MVNSPAGAVVARLRPATGGSTRQRRAPVIDEARAVRDDPPVKRNGQERNGGHQMVGVWRQVEGTLPHGQHPSGAIVPNVKPWAATAVRAVVAVLAWDGVGFD